MNKMPPLVAAPVPIPPSSTSMALASHLTDIYGHHPHQGHATPPMAALSNQHRQLLELQTRYLAASRLAALGGAAGGVASTRTRGLAWTRTRGLARIQSGLSSPHASSRRIRSGYESPRLAARRAPSHQGRGHGLEPQGRGGEEGGRGCQQRVQAYSRNRGLLLLRADR